MLLGVSFASAQANDDCSDATAIACGDVVQGSTIGATPDATPECGLSSVGPGVWYEIDGIGADITVSTCNPGTDGDFDTELAIFSGSCGSLVCEASNTNAGVGSCENPRLSTVTFASESGETYYIYVTGAAGDEGDFELSVECDEVPTTNDVCDGATPLTVGAPGVCDPVDGNTEDATADGDFSCDSFGDNAGLWYSFVAPAGGIVNLQVEDLGPGNPEAALFDACGGTEVFCDGSPDSEVIAGLTPGATYYLIVWGDVSFGQGPFTVCVSEIAPLANDDVCDAEPLELGVEASFDNSTATAQAGEPNPGAGTGSSSCNSTDGWCSFELDVDNSIWYTFVGPASGCVNIDVLDADLQLAVWEVGDCADFSTFVEVGANDDGGPGLSPALSSLTVTPGVTYYVQIDGYNGATETDGTVLVSEGAGCEPPEPPVAVDCSEALDLNCGEVVSGNTSLGVVNALGSCDGTNVSTAPGVWYAFEGDNSLVTLSTCSDATDYDSKIAVFSGECDELTCVAANDNVAPGSCSFGRASEVSFAALSGVTYYVYVTGHQGANGNFEMSVDCSVINDECANAISIECGDTVTGNTEEATSDDVPFCGAGSTSAPGVWYTTTGNGNTLTASLCGSDYDTKLFVYEGACGALSCITGNDDFCGLDSQVSWDSEDGVTYYILVTGFSTFSDGDYILSIPGECGNGGGGGGDCTADGIIDDACDADCVEVGTPVNFSNSGATVQTGEPDPGAGTTGPAPSCDAIDGWCSFEPQPFLDNTVWFTFTAPASGCVDIAATGADLQLAIWSVGDCSDFGTYTEVAANDDGGPGTTPALFDLQLTPGETYYVQIDGYNGSSATNGTLTITDCDAPVAGCDTATEILCGDAITGSTVGAPVTNLGTCGTALNTAGGVFYRFVGTGDNVTVTTCNAGSDYDTKLGVFTNTCSDLVCVGGNDDSTCSFSGLRSTVTFATTNGQDYYIYVTGFGAATGTYEVSVSCAAPITSGGTTLANPTAGSLDVNTYQERGEFGVGDFFPNPAQYDQTNVRIYAPVEAEATIQLFDQVGRLAHNLELDLAAGVNNVELTVNDLPAGTYYAIIRAENAVFNRKLVITK